MKKILTPLILVLLSNLCLASSANSNFQTSAIINPACSLSFSNISFGNITLTSTTNTISANGTFSLQCSKNISTNTGLNSSGAAAKGALSGNKYMLGTNTNTDYIKYKINKPSGFTNGLNGWGPPGLNGLTIVTSGNLEVYNFTTTLDTNQNVLPDNYSDTITATITF